MGDNNGLNPADGQNPAMDINALIAALAPAQRAAFIAQWAPPPAPAARVQPEALLPSAAFDALPPNHASWGETSVGRTVCGSCSDLTAVPELVIRALLSPAVVCQNIRLRGALTELRNDTIAEFPHFYARYISAVPHVPFPVGDPTTLEALQAISTSVSSRVLRSIICSEIDYARNKTATPGTRPKGCIWEEVRAIVYDTGYGKFLLPYERRVLAKRPRA